MDSHTHRHTDRQTNRHTDIHTCKYAINQGLFCHDQVSSGKFFAFFYLWRNLQMFLDTMEPSTENKNLS